MLTIGGIGEAVCSAAGRVAGISVNQLAITEVPRSGKGPDLLELFGISASSIVTTVRDMLSTGQTTQWTINSNGWCFNTSQFKNSPKVLE